MRRRPVFLVSLAAILVGSAMLMVPAYAFFADDQRGTATEQPTPTGQPVEAAADQGLGANPLAMPGLASADQVRVDTDDFWSWAVVEHATGEVVGAPNFDAPSTTASMIKVWLAADELRLATESGQEPDQQRLADISDMIRDSANDPATLLYDVLGGADSINRMIDRCALTDSAPSWRWSLTEMSARDAARLGACVASGHGAGPEWTDWLLDEMRLVHGYSDFGMREAFPPAVRNQIAIKNGYFARPEDGLWHISCLAVADEWSMAVIQRYPEELGRGHGEEICRSVAQQLRRP